MLRRVSQAVARNQRVLPAASRQLQFARAASTVDVATPQATSTPPLPITNTSLAPVESQNDVAPELRLPLAVQAIYYNPLKRPAKYGVPVCDLQIRSFSVRNLEFFCDFALRAAYYLNLSASGPIPLPKRTERWTVPRSNFVHKKAQENFERVTFKRLIQIKDGHPETVQIWLAFLRKHEYHGLGMKANVWTFERLGTGKKMGSKIEESRDVSNASGNPIPRSKQISNIKEAFKRSQRRDADPSRAASSIGMQQAEEVSYIKELQASRPEIRAAERDEAPEPQMPDEHEEQEYQKREQENQDTPREDERLKEHEKPGQGPGAGDKPQEVESQHLSATKRNQAKAQKPRETAMEVQEKPKSAPKPGEPNMPPKPSENEELVHQDRSDEVPKELKEAKERQRKGEEPPQEPSA